MKMGNVAHGLRLQAIFDVCLVWGVVLAACRGCQPGQAVKSIDTKAASLVRGSGVEARRPCAWDRVERGLAKTV